MKFERLCVFPRLPRSSRKPGPDSGNSNDVREIRILQFFANHMSRRHILVLSDKPDIRKVCGHAPYGSHLNLLNIQAHLFCLNDT